MVCASILYVASPTISEAQREDQIVVSDIYSQTNQTHKEKDPFENSTTLNPARTGKYVVIHLDQMNLELKDGANTLKVIPLISQGKPGSYYETIGGEYIHDYKLKNHFSSIGHVYMPYSIHVFGNYFIHGIPYYPDGTKVSSTYSGGCIRLSDEDAKIVYDFVERGTPIIITRNGEESFAKGVQSSSLVEDMQMTRHMVAMISLEFLTQDNTITGPNGELTTRRTLLPKLINNGDDNISLLYAQALGQKTYVDYMNQKAKALGLANTVFISVEDPAMTTLEDSAKFTNYIDTYKTYLRKIESATSSAK
jgi:hypothetical protein